MYSPIITLLFIVSCFSTFANEIENGNNKLVSAETDYFRTNQDGEWNSVSTWQSSADSITWMAATLVPNANSTRVSIFDSVYNIQGVSIDQLTIESGGILTNNTAPAAPGVFTILNGTDTDFTIKNGGTYYIVGTITYGAHTTLSINSNTLVQTGGKIKVGNGVNAVGSNNHTIAATSAISRLVFWEDDAVFEWNATNAPTVANITFFTNSLDYSTPIFRINTQQLTLGGSSSFATYINGRLETNAKVKITSTGDKLFRGGVLNNDSLVVTGKMIFDDGFAMHNCQIGGTGVIQMLTQNLVLGGQNLFEVGLVSDKKIVGNITLQNRVMVLLNNYNLTVEGTIDGGSGMPTRFINSNGSGKLKINNVGATPIIFPMGNYNGADEVYCPATLVNNGTVDNFAVNLSQQYPQCLTTLQQQNSVKAEWDITEDMVGGSNVQLTLSYGINGFIQSDVGPGYTAAGAQIVHCSNATTADYANGSVNGTTVTGTGTGFTSFSPFGITSDIALLTYLPLPTNFKAALTPSNSVFLTWSLDNQANYKFQYIEKSTDGINFAVVKNLAIVNNTPHYNWEDNNLIAPINYYRIKVLGHNNKVFISDIQKVELGKAASSLIIYPSPATNLINVLPFAKSSNAKSKIEIIGSSGNVYYNSTISNYTIGVPFQINISSLPKGFYYLKYTTNNKAYTSKFVKQ